MFNEYEIVKMLSDAQNYRAQQEAAAYGAQSQTGGAGALGAILAGINGYRSTKKGEQAAEMEAQAQQALAEREQEQSRQQAEAAQAQKKAQYQALLGKVDPATAQAIVYGGQSLKDLKPEQTAQMQNLASMGLKPNTPEYNQAMQQILNKPGATTNIQMPGTEFGPIPKGHMMQRGPDGSVQMVPVPGSPAAKEAQQAKTKDVMRGMSGWNDAGNIDEVIEKSLSEAGMGTTGLIGAIGSLIPGTDAHDLKENMKTIEADAAFSTLQNMRDNSKSGGALGQVSERELGLLSAAKAALSTSQSPEQFKENLRRYQMVRRQAMMNTAKAYQEDYGQRAPWLPKEQEQTDYSGMSDEELVAQWKAKQGQQ